MIHDFIIITPRHSIRNNSWRHVVINGDLVYIDRCINGPIGPVILPAGSTFYEASIKK